MELYLVFELNLEIVEIEKKCARTKNKGLK
jgi:hypothetical protein